MHRIGRCILNTAISALAKPLYNRALTDMLAPHRGRNSRASLDITPSTSTEASDTTSVVLPSFTELFYLYGQIQDLCSKLFIGKPLLELAFLRKKWLKIYAGTSLWCKEDNTHNIVEEVLLSSLKRWCGSCTASLLLPFLQTADASRWLNIAEKYHGKV